MTYPLTSEVNRTPDRGFARGSAGLRWRVFRAFPYAVGLLVCLAPCRATATPADPAAALERALAAAETSLRDGELAAAESQYRAALPEGWRLLGALATVESVADPGAPRGEGQGPRARVRAGRRIPGAEEGRPRGGLVRGDRPRAPDPPDPRPHRPDLERPRRVRARTRGAARGPEAGPARAARPLLPGPGRARGGTPDRDRRGDRRSSRPKSRSPPTTRSRTSSWGSHWSSASCFAEALPALEVASRAEPPQARALAYLGRAQLGLDRPGEAAASLGRALALATAQGANRPALLAIHLHLGQALQRLGRQEEAAAHFAESQRLSAEGTDDEREQLARYLADAADPAGRERALPTAGARSRCSGV